MTPSAIYWFFVKTRAFLHRDLVYDTSYKLQGVMQVMGIVMQILIFYYLSKMVAGGSAEDHLAPYGSDYFSFVLVGIAFSGIINGGLVNFTHAIRSQLSIGVFESMAATPIRSWSLLYYSMLYPMGYELVRSAIYLLLGMFLLGAEVRVTNGALLIVAFLLSLIVFGSLGIIAASLIVFFKRGDPLAWMLSAVTALVGGVYFPISLLPSWVQALAKLFPVPYALDLFRATLLPSASLDNAGTNLFVLAFFAVILLPIVWFSSTVMMDKAREQGTLGQY